MSSFDKFEHCALRSHLGLVPVGEDAKNMYFVDSRGNEVKYTRTYVETIRTQLAARAEYHQPPRRTVLRRGLVLRRSPRVRIVSPRHFDAIPDNFYD